ncbi:MAG: DUF5696 domain-containing protein [Oscillospiraceae bacterium]|jgi:hypothetical protein|nr:DUF5696 domain-containing protein [Oscillospiraceae bacterium]
MKKKQKLRLGTKLILSILGTALLITLAYQGYLTLRYRLHRDYRSVLSDNADNWEFEEGTPFLGTKDPDSPDGMVLAARNNILKLFVNPDTAEAAVLDKRTGVMTYTNPPEAANDPVAISDINRSILQSQLIVDYFDTNRRDGRFNSFDLSTSLGQFELESLNNGFRCTYTIGDMSYEYGVVPLYITRERLDYFREKMSTNGARIVAGRYIESTEAPGFLTLTPEARIGNLTTNQTLRTLNGHFTDAGYSEEDLNADMSASGVEGAVPLGFVVPLEYRLDGDSLVVSIPTSHITEKGGGRISRIELLRTFGAGGSEEEGYMMVPNGSGSIIYFNNEKTFAEEYRQYVYGLDPMMSEYIILGNSEPARMPYFGIQRTGETAQGILAEIQAGDTLADITADTAGRLNSYNYVFPAFTLRGSISLAMFGTTGNEATLPVVEANMAQVNLTVRYNFLTDEYEGYSGMARYAREQLIERGVLTPKSEAGDIPLYMSIVGSAGGQRRFLSVSYWGQYPMTTFAQASEITDVLAENGITNQVINYQGWFNRGYYNEVPDRIRLVRQLGSRRELEALSQRVESRGGKLFLDTTFQRVSFASRRYNWQLETSRYYGGGMVAVLGQTCPDCYSNRASLGYVETLYNLLSPKFLGRYVNNFIRAFNSYDVTGVSLRDLGSDLHSDRKRTEMITREEAKIIVLDSLGRLEAASPLMISGGNSYSFGFASDFINVPIAHNEFYIVDEEIPFYQMLLSGSADYAGPPINLTGGLDEEAVIVRLIEFGASPHFAFTAENSSGLKYTGLNHVYSATFSNWSDTAVRIYNAVNEALSQVSDSFIVKHEILPGGRRVTYDNGVVFEINGNSFTVREAAW